jgi:hypothetical protein
VVAVDGNDEQYDSSAYEGPSSNFRGEGEPQVLRDNGVESLTGNTESVQKVQRPVCFSAPVTDGDLPQQCGALRACQRVN